MKSYMSIWRQFNCFVINLDHIPNSWEERATLFVVHLIAKGAQSDTVKSYVSAIKATLVNDDYAWNDNKLLLTSLARACKVVNDKVRTRLPISCALLEVLLFETE